MLRQREIICLGSFKLFFLLVLKCNIVERASKERAWWRIIIIFIQIKFSYTHFVYCQFVQFRATFLCRLQFGCFIFFFFWHKNRKSLMTIAPPLPTVVWGSERERSRQHAHSKRTPEEVEKKHYCLRVGLRKSECFPFSLIFVRLHENSFFFIAQHGRAHDAW